jgi:hypothetical protein
MGWYLCLTVYVRQNFMLSDCDVMVEQDYCRVTCPLLYEHSLYALRTIVSHLQSNNV